MTVKGKVAARSPTPKRPKGSPHDGVEGPGRTQEKPMSYTKLHMKFAVAISTILLCASAFAATENLSFTTIDNPSDPTFNQLLGIDKSGVISGYFGSGAPGHPNKGYITAPPYTTFESDNLPGSTQTQATGIANNGVTVGFWSPTNAGGDANFGFIREANGFTYLSVNNPLGASSPQVQQVLGINTSNIAVGFYTDANNLAQGYAYNVKTGAFTPVTTMGAVSATATGINNHGLICGFFTNAGGKVQGFLQNLQGNSKITFAVPGSSNTQLFGVNDGGIVVGSYIDGAGVQHGLSYNATTGNWTTIDDPNAAGMTVVNGINDKGDAVGFYLDAAGNTHGMLVTGVH